MCMSCWSICQGISIICIIYIILQLLTFAKDAVPRYYQTLKLKADGFIWLKLKT